jgi:hypothetical protein
MSMWDRRWQAQSTIEQEVFSLTCQNQSEGYFGTLVIWVFCRPHIDVTLLDGFEVWMGAGVSKSD